MKTPLMECYALHTKFLTGSRSIKHRFNAVGSDFSFCTAPGAIARVVCISDYRTLIGLTTWGYLDANGTGVKFAK